MHINDFLNRLEKVEGSHGRWKARCPAHEDKNPSMSIGLSDDGKILVNCFRGCTAEQITVAMGLALSDLYIEPPKQALSSAARATKEAEYLYAGGQLKKVKYRNADGSKFCSWLHKDGNSWVKGRKGIAPGLYQSQPDLPEVVFLVEGEKDVDNLKRAGLPAVTLPDGSQSKWEPEYSAAFSGKRVLILPDNDEPGMKYAQMCAGKLYGNAEAIWILDLKQAWPEMPLKADISDMFVKFGADEAIQRVMALDKLIPQWAPAKEDPEEDPFLSLFKPLDEFTEEEASWLIPGWVPEAQITLMAADGGVGKTTLWCHIIAALSSGRACILDPPGFRREPQKIAFCTTEDSVKKKLLKKLREAGANLKNIITMDFSEDKSGALRNFKFGSSELDRFVKHFKPALCVFDPVQGFLPPLVNMAARNQMRDCMAPLITLGEDTGTTFMVICHTNKRKGASGRDRIADSADLWDIARSVIMAGYTESQGVRYLSNEKNNYSQLQETMLFSIDSSGSVSNEGTTWKRDKDYMIEAVAAKSAPKREDCKDFILRTLGESPGRCMKSDDLNKLAESYGYSFATINRVRGEMSKEGMLEKYTTGSSKRGDRVHYVRLPVPGESAFHELPYELPTPFDTPLD